MHDSWRSLGHERLVQAGATESWLRLHYAEWCTRHELTCTPVSALISGIDVGDPGWRLLALSREDFDHCQRLAGWTLQFAAFPAHRLARGGDAASLDERRWCLARAPLIPVELACGLLRQETPGPQAWAEMSAASLAAWVKPVSPTTWPRLRLRCDRAAIAAAESAVYDSRRAEDTGRALGALGARLWRAALRETVGFAQLQARARAPADAGPWLAVEESTT
jgi:hypothetical protein